MKIEIDISQKTLDDLTMLADFHAVLIEDVIRHYITDGIEAEKSQQLGPWESVDNVWTTGAVGTVRTARRMRRLK